MGTFKILKHIVQHEPNTVMAYIGTESSTSSYKNLLEMREIVDLDRPTLSASYNFYTMSNPYGPRESVKGTNFHQWYQFPIKYKHISEFQNKGYTLHTCKSSRGSALFCLTAFMFWSFRGYTLKRDGWHKTFTKNGRAYSVYQFSKWDGVKEMTRKGEVPF